MVGLDGASLSTVRIDLADGHLLVSGPSRSGRSTALATMAATLDGGVRRMRRVFVSGRADRPARGEWDLVMAGADLRSEMARLEACDVPTFVFVDDAGGFAILWRDDLEQSVVRAGGNSRG